MVCAVWIYTECVAARNVGASVGRLAVSVLAFFARLVAPPPAIDVPLPDPDVTIRMLGPLIAPSLTVAALKQTIGKGATRF